jgi:WD40 repeat protein
VTDASVLGQVTRTVGPYPGLRPFDDDEAEIFFGRETQTDQLLEKLQRSHFIAVVGPSGCGKSSLVRAGMIASLESGFLAGTGTAWRIAAMRPGDRPLARLTEALLEPSALGPERGSDASEAAIAHAMLRRGPLGLLEILRETPLPANSSLLLLVDQFEEIFRFRKQGNADEADAFVALLLATVAQREEPVYVVITMRSDFLGDCALFTGLPEAINDGQYLTPRLSREQIRSAITGPARVFGGEVEPTLVNHLLNEIGPDPDQLPLLQHALMRMWVEVHGGSGEYHRTPSARSPLSPVLTMVQYEAIGSVSKALSQHADHVLGKMDERQKQIAKAMLTRLTERGSDRRDTRRPTRLDDVAAVSGATDQEVIAVVEQLRVQGCSFLTPPPPVDLTASTVLDIGHESLIRQWHQLYQWVEEEAAAATRYRRLAERAELNARHEADLLTDRELAVTLEWHREWRPNAAWARRYHPGFEAAEDFLEQSRAAHSRRRLERIAGIVASAMLLLAILAGILVASAKSREQKARTAEANELAAHAVADKHTAEAIAAQLTALADTVTAQRDSAMMARAEADSARLEAEALSRKLLSQVTADSARDLLQEDPDRALLLAVKAFSQDTTPQAKGILQQALLARRPRELAALGANHRGFGSPDGRYVAIPDSMGMLRVWETGTGHQVAVPPNLGGKSVRPFFSPNGPLWGLLDSANARITILDTRTWKVVSTLQGPVSRRQFPSFSSDAKHLIAWGADQHPRIWEAATGREVGEIGAGSVRITSASFSPNGKYILAIDSVDHVASLWDAGSRELRSTLGVSKGRPIRGGRFSPDTRLILLTMVDARFPPIEVPVERPEAAMALPGAFDTTRVRGTAVNPPGAPQFATFNPRGRTILAVSGDTIRLWRTRTDPRPYRLAGSGAVRSARFSQDGRLILSAGADGKATLWEVANGRKVASFSGGTITNAWLSADSRQVLTTSQDGILRAWSAFEFGKVFPLAGLCQDTTSSGGACEDQLAFNQEFPAEITANGKYLLARDTKGIASIWDVSSGALKARLDSADRASFSPDGKRAITTPEDGTAKVWDVEAGRPMASLEHRVSGESLFLGSFGDSNHPWAWHRTDSSAVITVWNFKDQPTPHPSLTVKPSPGCVTLSPDAAWLATCEEAGDEAAPVIRARRFPSSDGGKLLTGHTGALIDVFFSGDGRFAASTSYDKTAIVWEVGTWRSVAKLSPHEAAVQYAFFSADSREVATIDDAFTVRVWETGSGKPISELRGHTARVKVLAFSNDGPWLVTGSEDRTARVWDSRTGQQVAVLQSHGPVIAVAFMPGSRGVITASADGTIRKYSCDLCVPTTELLSRAGQLIKASRTAP